jgi:hypothetical protein
MSTKIGIITEGAIDDLLLPVLLSRIADDRASYKWPVTSDDLGQILPLRKRGHGGVVESVKRLVGYLTQNPPTDHAFFVILLDRRTQQAQDEVRRFIKGNSLFILGIAIEEIEAWWLADREAVRGWLGLDGAFPRQGRYWQKGYNAEKDDDPKRTLDELTRESTELDQCYGTGNKSLTEEFAELWQQCANLNSIDNQCPKGFRPFCKQATDAFNREKAKKGRLFT